ncbi:MAG: Holliday junction resolvase RuvX [Nitrospirae bacterium]|nr:Holliday junction resolvase RuvX [Nitrospirota bacterium]
MRILGLDIGNRTIGVAISDEMGWTAQGLKTLIRKGFNEELSSIKEIIEEYGVKEILVGLPKNMNGSIGPQGKKVITFVERLKTTLPLPVLLWDERLSTVRAEKVLLEADMSRKKRKGLKDKLAAQFILQGYLDRKASGT